MNHRPRTDRPATDRLASALPGRTPVPDEWRSALAARADDEDLLDVAYRVLPTSIGDLLLAATTDGLVRVAFAAEGFDAVLDDLAGRISPRLLESPRRTEVAAVQLEEYLAGDRREFTVDLDLRLASGFRREVVARLPRIDYGSTASYREVATALGRPTAVRAVGGACSHNPVPLVLPCHRVVRSDGTIGAYLGGTDMKARLLELERAVAA